MTRIRATDRATEIVLWVLCLLFVFPLLYVFVDSFKSFREIMMTPLALPTRLYLSSYVEIWNRTKFPIVFFNTLVYSIGTTVLILILSSMAAYKLARSRTRLSAVILGLFVVPFIVPFQVVMIPVATMANHFGFKNSIWALVLISTGFFCPLSLLLYNAFVRATPRSIEESAIMDGCSGYSLFFRIVFPLLKPITGTLIVVNFVRCWNEFLLPLILITNLRKQTIPLSQMIMYSQYTNNRWNLLLTGGVLAIVPILIVFLFAQKFIIRGLTSGALKE